MSLVTILSLVAGQPLFFLRGAASTYAFGVHATGTLCHLHWGGPITPDASLAVRLDPRPAAFSPENAGPRGGSRLTPPFPAWCAWAATLPVRRV